MLTINDLILKTPSQFKVTIQDIDSANTTRMADGGMVRDRVVGGAQAKRKLQIGYKVLKPDELSAILQAISDEFFTVTYPDPYEGNLRTAVFYVGDRSVEMYNYIINNGLPLWQNLEFNFIEQ